MTWAALEIPVVRIGIRSLAEARTQAAPTLFLSPCCRLLPRQMPVPDQQRPDGVTAHQQLATVPYARDAKRLGVRAISRYASVGTGLHAAASAARRPHAALAAAPAPRSAAHLTGMSQRFELSATSQAHLAPLVTARSHSWGRQASYVCTAWWIPCHRSFTPTYTPRWTMR